MTHESIKHPIPPKQAPLLRWAGSKRQILEDLKYYWPPAAQRYVEPFCGSACLFFDAVPSKAVLGDINDDLIRTYRTLKAYPTEVWKSFSSLQATKREYYRIRKQDPNLLDPIERSARFIFLNRLCFNGLYRTNQKGLFNVPYGGRRQRKVTPERITSIASLLKRATFVSGDFQKTLNKVRVGDFVYPDPPYALTTRKIFSEYARGSFATSDLDRLTEELRRITALGAWFLLSYADTPAMRQQFGEWFIRRVVTRRNIAGFAGHRRHSHEILVANFPLPKK